MFSRRLLTAARVAQLRRPMQQPLRGVPLPAMLNQVRTYADTLVKVPQMAESISEGTLKQWNKQIGDYVEADEEIATIETDKIDVAVNAPEAGVIKELMANEEDTVTVGQEIAKIEAGAAPEGGNKGESKEEAPKEESASTDAKPAEPKEENKPEPSKPAPKPEPKKETPP
ncbi:hypothetical protein PG999_004161 [Apiospora kogelbergensis]|uniref:Lipoyl-binding domain-containing protein n=2 Tax=Apiospora kogelbergensis TaxID=1337665 RepID=A0AAW0QYF4_9PEZI